MHSTTHRTYHASNSQSRTLRRITQSFSSHSPTPSPSKHILNTNPFPIQQLRQLRSLVCHALNAVLIHTQCVTPSCPLHTIYYALPLIMRIPPLSPPPLHTIYNSLFPNTQSPPPHPPHRPTQTLPRSPPSPKHNLSHSSSIPTLPIHELSRPPPSPAHNLPSTLLPYTQSTKHPPRLHTMYHAPSFPTHNLPYTLLPYTQSTTHPPSLRTIYHTPSSPTHNLPYTLLPYAQSTIHPPPLRTIYHAPFCH